MSLQQGETERVFLDSYLAPLTSLLARDDVTDIYVNGPGDVWAETLRGQIERHQLANIDDVLLERLARQIAALTHQGISREHPLLSATLPDGARVQVIGPPATRGSMVMAIRKHVSSDLSLADYVAMGAFSATRLAGHAPAKALEQALAERLAGGDVAGALAMAVKGRRNILVSGGTSTGKTTFLNALLNEVPAEERLVIIEDTPELLIRHENAVGLVAVRSELGEAQVTANDLVTATLRMRPDRIILGELRGAEAGAFLRAVNTGHPGSMTTIHADSPDRAVEQLALLVLQSGTRLNRADVLHHVRSTIDVFVQLTRTGGARKVSEVMLGGRNIVGAEMSLQGCGQT